jgi:hypothetical protein
VSEGSTKKVNRGFKGGSVIGFEFWKGGRGRRVKNERWRVMEGGEGENHSKHKHFTRSGGQKRGEEERREGERRGEQKRRRENSTEMRK